MARTGRPPTPVDIDAIRHLTEQGWRMGRIADHLGVSRSVVWGAMKRHNIPRHDPHSLPGEHNPAWKGGRQIDKDGYVLIHRPDHPRATSHGYVREHRLVMERVLGRYLTPEEVVHHRDGNKQHNDPENLQVFARNRDHLAETLRGKRPNWTPEGFAAMQENGRKYRSPVSEETRAKMRASQRNRVRAPHSAETREKIRQAALQRASAKRMSTHPASETDGDPSR